jgi:hypothetical protein
MGMDCECMDGAGQFRRQQRIYHAMAVDAGLPFERLRHDINPEMRFAARPVASVPFMQMGLIRNVEAFRRESFAQLICDRIPDRHDPRNIVRYSRRSIAVSIAVHPCGDVYSAFSKIRFGIEARI